MADSWYNFTTIDGNAFDSQDCDHLVKIWHYIKFNRTEESRHYIAYGNKNDVYGYIVEGFDDYLRSNSLPKPPETQQFWDWSISLYSPITRQGLSECPPQMCKAIGWQGSPDLSGVGMIVTYSTQAMLVTFYLISILIIRLDCFSRLRKWRIISRTLHAAQHSTAEFLSASSIFSLSLMTATLHSIAKGNSINRWISVVALIIPLSSILSTIILHVAASSMLRRSRGRVLPWVVLELLMIAAFVVSGTVSADEATISTMEDNSFASHHPCVESVFRKTVIFALAVSLVLLLGIAVYVFDSLISMIRNRPGPAAQIRNKLQWVTIGACFCAMWFFIWWLINLTWKIQSRTGGNNNDTEWTFGQVLALATWVPPMLEFAYVWWEEPLRALNGRLMGPYEVVETPVQESLVEMGKSSGFDERGHFQEL